MSASYERKNEFYSVEIVEVLAEKLYNEHWMDSFSITDLYDLLRMLQIKKENSEKQIAEAEKKIANAMKRRDKDAWKKAMAEKKKAEKNAAKFNGDFKFSYSNVHSAVIKLVEAGILIKENEKSKRYLPDNHVLRRKKCITPIVDQINIEKRELFRVSNNVVAIYLSEAPGIKEKELFEQYLDEDVFSVSAVDHLLLLMLHGKGKYLEALIEDLQDLAKTMYEATCKRKNKEEPTKLVLSTLSTKERIAKEMHISHELFDMLNKEKRLKKEQRKLEKKKLEEK